MPEGAGAGDAGPRDVVVEIADEEARVAWLDKRDPVFEWE
jgi:hypothetical protein